MRQCIVAKSTLAVTTQWSQQYTLHCYQQCTNSVTVHRCKRYTVTFTVANSALFRYTGANSTLLQHTVANSTLIVLQYTVANNTLLSSLLPTVYTVAVHCCQQYTLQYTTADSTRLIAHFYSTPLPKVHCCAKMTSLPPTLNSRSDIAPQQAIVLSADDAIFCPF